jgi:hypothetical protein
MPAATGCKRLALNGLKQHPDRRRAAHRSPSSSCFCTAGAAPSSPGLTLPIAVISSFIAVYAFGFTLNFMTMMALSLCIGLLIDDAIVVRENIVRHVGDGQRPCFRAAREGTEEIGLAVMATTFAIVAVFAPVAFMGGIIGKFFYPFGITVVVAVLVSLFVSFTLDPMLFSVWHDPPSTRLKSLCPSSATRSAPPTVRWTSLHVASMNALIHWIFSDRRWIAWAGAACSASRLCPWFSMPMERRDKASARHAGAWATITPRGVVMMCRCFQFHRRAWAWRRWWAASSCRETDQGYTQLSVAPAGRQPAWSAASAKVQPDRGNRAGACPRCATISTWVGGAGQRNQAWLNIALKDAQGAQPQPEAGGGSDPQIHRAQVPGTDASASALIGRSTSPSWAATPTAWPSVADAFAEKVKKIPGVGGCRELGARPGLPAYAVRLKSRPRCVNWA